MVAEIDSCSPEVVATKFGRSALGDEDRLVTVVVASSASNDKRAVFKGAGGWGLIAGSSPGGSRSASEAGTWVSPPGARI